MPSAPARFCRPTGATHTTFVELRCRSRLPSRALAVHARRMKRFVLLLFSAALLAAQTPPPPAPAVVLKPARVFDGEASHENWIVVVRGERIEAVGPAADVRAPDGAKVIELPGATLLPGLIEAHSHVLLHPYNETTWNDQVAREPLARDLVVPRRL